MLDDSRVATRLLALGVALFAFGLGCHFWADRVYRTAGLVIGAVQLYRYLLTSGISKTEEMNERRLQRLKACDHVTAVLLIMATLHAATTMTM
jgi:hypothetical protein